MGNAILSKRDGSQTVTIVAMCVFPSELLVPSFSYSAPTILIPDRWN